MVTLRPLIQSALFCLSDLRAARRLSGTSRILLVGNGGLQVSRMAREGGAKGHPKVVSHGTHALALSACLAMLGSSAGSESENGLLPKEAELSN